MRINKVRASGVEASLYRCFICWMGNHQVVIHSYFIVTSAFLTATSLAIAHLKFYCATGTSSSWPVCIHCLKDGFAMTRSMNSGL